MPLDVKSIELPPPGVRLRLPPKNLRELGYEEKYQQVRRHLKDDGPEAAMSVQMKSQVRIINVEPLRVREGD